MPKARQVFGFAIFLVVALGIIGSAHHYYWMRLVVQPHWPEPLTALGTWAVWGGALLLVTYPFIERTQPPRVAQFFVWPGFVWMGACFYLLLGLWVSDLLRLVLSASGVEVARMQAAGVLGVTLAVLIGGGWNALRGPVLKEVELRMPRWPRELDGYRLVQISDIHIGATLHRGFAQKLVDMANGARPDLIAVTGDLVDGSVAQLADEVAPFASLRARDGVFFVAGNHDHYSGARSWLKKAEDLGMTVLRNRHQVVERAPARFVLAGVDDPTGKRSGGRGDDVDAAVSGAPAEVPTILLAHDPRCFDRAAGKQIDLQISGHTHGGQMWPFGMFVRLQTRFLAGRYAIGASQLYVSRGTGFWGPPIRMFAPSELTVLVLRPAE
jgi:hypothetical protein